MKYLLPLLSLLLFTFFSCSLKGYPTYITEDEKVQPSLLEIDSLNIFCEAHILKFFNQDSTIIKNKIGIVYCFKNLSNKKIKVSLNKFTVNFNSVKFNSSINDTTKHNINIEAKSTNCFSVDVPFKEMIDSLYKFEKSEVLISEIIFLVGNKFYNGKDTKFFCKNIRYRYR